ncbi:MAG TPA: 2-C-methyl-D-erythritol 4-phosphate cytidylyltransferase [Dehalococcoidia bacterium]|nr:2-C-methyl-D-erythritol 4-phosphate cytidylyltransferase [Dehalococcoidia bacterium]
MAVGAVIVAAGRSERMGGTDKLLQPLGGRPLIGHSIAVFATHSAIDRLVVVVSEMNRPEIEAIVSELAPRATVVLGGKRRRDSVRNGLEALEGCDYVLIHDGARPLVTPALIDAALEGARTAGAALCAVPITDTIKRAAADMRVRGTISRENLWRAQTPQAFRRDLLLHAHAASDVDATDDAALVELIDEPVLLVPGSIRNVKVTLPEDLRLAAAWLIAGES